MQGIGLCEFAEFQQVDVKVSEEHRTDQIPAWEILCERTRAAWEAPASVAYAGLLMRLVFIEARVNFIQ
jgi:hypothetical protein